MALSHRHNFLSLRAVYDCRGLWQGRHDSTVTYHVRSHRFIMPRNTGLAINLSALVKCLLRASSYSLSHAFHFGFASFIFAIVTKLHGFTISFKKPQPQQTRRDVLALTQATPPAAVARSPQGFLKEAAHNTASLIAWCSRLLAFDFHRRFILYIVHSRGPSSLYINIHIACRLVLFISPLFRPLVAASLSFTCSAR